MPFTLSHPIAVAPLRKLFGHHVPLAAWVIGAMVPDVAYFVALRPTGSLGHTPWGVLVQGLPSGLVLYALWVWVLRRPLRETLPEWVVARWEVERKPVTRGSGRHVLAVSVGIVGGAITHLIWDSFTHATGVGVAHMPVLTRAWGGLEVYRWLQYGGGVVGGVGVLVWMGWGLVRGASSAEVGGAQPRGKWWAWAWCVMSSVAGAWAALAPVMGASHHVRLVCAVIGTCTGFGVGAVMYAAAWHLVRWWRGRGEGAPV